MTDLFRKQLAAPGDPEGVVEDAQGAMNGVSSVVEGVPVNADMPQGRLFLLKWVAVIESSPQRVAPVVNSMTTVMEICRWKTCSKVGVLWSSGHRK